MSSYPWDYEETVRIDADDILDYVEDNKDWFLSKLGIDNTKHSLEKKITDLIDKYDNIRRFRDISSNNRDNESVKLYEDLVALKNTLQSM